MWLPDLGGRSGPRYIAIADALAADIADGRLAAGMRLPTHRELAYRIGVTVGTVSRAYREADRRGLISGEVGRGTFVRREEAIKLTLSMPSRRDAGMIDLAANRPALGAAPEALSHGLTELANDPALPFLMDYGSATGADEHRALGAAWLAHSGLAATPENVIVTGGGQHAMTAIFAALMQAGDLLLTESLTFTGAIALAKLLNLRMQGLPMDADGLIPEAFESACRKGQVKMLYCVPTLQNPTTSVMPTDRRRDIAEIAAAHDVVVVEDDVYGFLVVDAPAPISSHAPDHCIYLTSTSKCFAPGLRVGYVMAPPRLVEWVALGTRSTVYMAPPLMVQLISRWIEDGTADRLAEFQRREARARQAILKTKLDGALLQTDPRSMHAWLRLPEPWRAGDFALQARQRGVAVAPAESFAADRAATPHAVRLCLGGAHDRDTLVAALAVLQELLSEPPAPNLSIV